MVGLPVGVMLGAAFLAFCWLARRGFEVTDEAFYLLHLMHWRQTEAAVGFFGLYFEWLLRGVGGDVALVRIFGWVVLVGSAAFATYEVLEYCAPSPPAIRWPFVLAGAASAQTHYAYLKTLRVPSYNLAVLVFALLATAVLLRARRLSRDQNRVRWEAPLAVIYGAAVTACAISKPTAGLLLAPLHLAFLLASGWGWRQARLWRFVAWAVVGAALSLGALQLANPGWPTVVRNGLAMLAAYGSHGDGVGSMAGLLAWQIKHMVVMAAPAAGALALFCAAMALIARRLRIAHLGIAEFVAVAAVVWFVLGMSEREAWWVLAFVALGAMLGRLLPGHLGQKSADSARVMVMLPCMAMLMCAPFALSFGTNTSVAAHASSNAVFAGMALAAGLHSMYASGRVGAPAAAAILATLAVPGLFVQWRASVDADATFRLRSPLQAQIHPVRLGPADHVLLVDDKMKAALDGLTDTARLAGWKPGAVMLDLTGDGPGWVYALGARPLAVPWLLGGYPGSNEAATRLLTLVDASRVREAWLLTSHDNPRRIAQWQAILEGRLGKGSHVPAGSVRVFSTYRSSRDARDAWTLQLWRPASDGHEPALAGGTGSANP